MIQMVVIILAVLVGIFGYLLGLGACADLEVDIGQRDCSDKEEEIAALFSEVGLLQKELDRYKRWASKVLDAYKLKYPDEE